MTDILEILSRHSRDNPIPMPALARQLGVTTRDVQKVIQSLREAGQPIGNRCDKPNGYWLAQTPMEAVEVAERYMKRGLEILRIGFRMKRQARKMMQAEPLPLPFEGRNVA